MVRFDGLFILLFVFCFLFRNNLYAVWETQKVFFHTLYTGFFSLFLVGTFIIRLMIKLLLKVFSIIT